MGSPRTPGAGGTTTPLKAEATSGGERTRSSRGCGIAGEQLHAALDDIEREYRKLGTNLLAKETAAILKPKDGS